MRKGIMALEGLEEPIENTDAAELAVAEGETRASELDNESDQIAETESIADSPSSTLQTKSLVK